MDKPVTHGGSPVNHGSNSVNHGSSPVNHGSKPVTHGDEKVTCPTIGCPVSSTAKRSQWPISCLRGPMCDTLMFSWLFSAELASTDQW